MSDSGRGFADESSSGVGSDLSDDDMYENLRAETEEKEVRKLTSKETQGVRTWKILTLLTILATAVSVAAGTFHFIDRQEETDFTESYKLFTQTIGDAVESHVKNLFDSIHDVAEQITKEASLGNQSFPFVTVPMFEVMASQARSASWAESVYWAPIISKEQRGQWVDYSVQNFNSLEQSRLYDLSQSGKTWEEQGFDRNPIRDFVFNIDGNANPLPIGDDDDSIVAPLWQMSPPPFSSSVLNYNTRFSPNVLMMETATDKLSRGLLDAVRDYSLNAGLGESVADHEAFHDALVDAERDENYNSYTHPHNLLIQPIHKDIFDKESEIAGHVFSLITWDAYLVDLLPDGVSGITAVVRNTCGQSYTYDLVGNKAFFKGDGDFHDKKYDDQEVVVNFFDFTDEELKEAMETPGHCIYSFHLFPTKDFEENYKSKAPILMTVVVASVFVFLVGVFFVYDHFVNRRNMKILNAAVKFNSIVSSLFPSNVRDRLFGEAMQDDTETQRKANTRNGKNRLKKYLGGAESDDEDEPKHDNIVDEAFYKTKPIADLFTDTTILFADLAGFTAWSSMREPTQVFILLETIYKAFDDIAKQRGVFKVETVGDCYVAVTGLPDPRKDHAVAMARFAADSMHRMHDLTAKLEVMLGPDTTDLECRVGMHSGPVTAGVLRGERSRFQLFGDTMNTASRMESNGQPGKIQCSQETADLLIAAGKQHWLTPREDKIIAKGKGELQTFWISTSPSGSSSGQRSAASELGNAEDTNMKEPDQADINGGASVKRDAKTERLVQWNVDVLLSLLRKVALYRGENEPLKNIRKWEQSPGSTVLDEVQEIITLPGYDVERQSSLIDPEDIDLGEEVEQQLHQYVSTVASLYRFNPFHNFEHASHVTMSVVKLMSRIVAPDVEATDGDLESTLHRYTFGITSDPLTQFACVFSALIHDVDHPGVPNTRLIEENPELAAVYRSKSVAEQNSVDLSWDLLQDDSFVDLRKAIHSSLDEQKRFRHLVVNSVMATDIMDKDLKALRNARWDKAFSENTNNDTPKDIIDRKATIVIEHLIQASDVAHTMQHWHIYRKWNERLFDEMYCAYIDGRSETCPTDSWYKGEIGFFDFYIIPLAKKLKNCGVFGVSSDEYLNYAEKNREEWEQRGQEVVAKMVEKLKKKYNQT